MKKYSFIPFLIIYIILGIFGGFLFVFLLGTLISSLLSNNNSIIIIYLLMFVWLWGGPFLSVFGIDLIFKKFNLATKIILSIISGIIIYAVMNSGRFLGI